VLGVGLFVAITSQDFSVEAFPIAPVFLAVQHLLCFAGPIHNWRFERGQPRDQQTSGQATIDFQRHGPESLGLPPIGASWLFPTQSIGLAYGPNQPQQLQMKPMTQIRAQIAHTNTGGGTVGLNL
jgi:hypothetical protein